MNKFLHKLQRWAGYLLFFLILGHFITGFGTTKGVIDREIAKELHEDILPIPTFLCFLVHGLINIRYFFMRRGVKNGVFLNLFIGLAGIALLVLFFYMFLRSPHL
jgi:hypothetical protein